MAFTGYSEVGQSGSKLEKILAGRKSGLFSKWHASGLKVSDPVLKIGNNGTYELNVADNKQKIQFKGLQDGNVDFKVEKTSGGYTCGFTKKMTGCGCTTEYEVESKGDKLSHSVKVDGSCNGINGFVKVGGDPSDPTVHGSFFFDVPMVSGLKAVMDAKSKISGGCENISGLHYSGCKDMCVAATIKNATGDAEVAVDVYKKMDKIETGVQVIHNLKSAQTNFVGAVGYQVDREHTLNFKVNKSGHLAFQLKKAFSPGFNLELGALCSASDFANPAGLKDSVKMGLKLNLKF